MSLTFRFFSHCVSAALSLLIGAGRIEALDLVTGNSLGPSRVARVNYIFGIISVHPKISGTLEKSEKSKRGRICRGSQSDV